MNVNVRLSPLEAREGNSNLHHYAIWDSLSLSLYSLRNRSNAECLFIFLNCNAIHQR